MKPIHDLIIGIIAITLGCWFLVGAIFQSPLLMQLTKSRLLVESLGSTTARWIIAALGLATIALGILIATSRRIHW
jgi:hypothetical protein